MNDTIKGALIGAIIPTIGSFAIFLMGNFSTQSSWEKATVEVFSERFDSVDKDMSYEEALQAVYEECESLKSENKDLKVQVNEQQERLNSQQAMIEQQNSIEEINQIIQEATKYWQNSEFVQALTILKNSQTKSVDIKSLYESYSIEYSGNLLEEVELLISERNYDEAIKILEQGKMLVYDNKEIRNMISKITNRKTALLSNLIPVSGEIEGIWDVSKRDNYGNKYSSGICLHQSYEDAAHVVYSLDGEYTILSGKFVLDEEYKNTDGNYVLYAYSLVDGNMILIYESQVLSTATRPINIEIDVTDVMDLVLEVYDPNKSSNNANTGFVDAKLE